MSTKKAMTTPIADFVRAYAESGISRYHMPGHKGRGPLGCEALDITEVRGADALYEAQGIIGESERNAAALFGTAATFYSAEGSSLCIRAMLHLAVTHRGKTCSRSVVAARNVHHTFLSAAALLDLDVTWLWPEDGDAFCSCPITPEVLRRTLEALPCPPAAVYVTSPDYLGNLAPIRALSEVCHDFGTMLLIDQAHGAYLNFLPENLHAIHQGADLCCDSAHKTLPVLTGGAYLHLSENTSEAMRGSVKNAMLLYGSTSPSYLILQSLDLCNAALAGDYPERLHETVKLLGKIRTELKNLGWDVRESDPMRITLRAPAGMTGYAIAQKLRLGGSEPEYADPEFCVLMITPDNTRPELFALPASLGKNELPARSGTSISIPRCPAVCSIREAAMHCGREAVMVQNAAGRVCASSVVSCPPCIPIAVSGERITEEAAALMVRLGIEEIEVLTP